MNCSRFRFLIQQWFDAPLSPQDERMLVAHVDSCDSCARFQHQLDQVVQGTPEVPLPDECLPSNLESLAKRIMDQIPQDKPGPFAFFKNLLSSFGGGAGGGKAAAPKAAAPKKGAAPIVESDDSLTGGSMFPHVRRKGGEDVKSSGAKKGAAAPQAVDEELLATSTRLKNLQQKLSPIQDEPQAQSQGLSLGSKFGVNVPFRDSGQGEDGPLTLAESIRRKVVEDNQQSSGSQNFGEAAQQFQDPNAAFAPPGQFGGGGFGAQPPMQGFGQPPVGQMPAAPQWGDPNAAPQGNWGDPGAAPQQAPPNWGDPNAAQQPQPTWGDPSAAQQPQPPQPQPGANWGDPPRPGVGGDSDWKPVAPVGDWQVAKPQTPAWGGGAPGQPAAPEQGSGGWGSAWPENAPDPNAEAAARRGQQPGWGDQQATSGSQQWGQPGQPAGNAPPAAGAQQWGQPAPSGWANDQQSAGWGGQQPAAPAQPAPAAPAAGWGQPAAPAWGDPQAASGGQNWGQQQQPAQQGWSDPQTTSGAQNWGQPGNQWQQQPAANAPAPGGAPAAGGWGAPPAPGSNGGWGGGQPANGGGWNNGATTGGAEPGWTNQSGLNPPPANVNPFLQPTAAPAAPGPAPADGFDSGWSEEGEQIQTGMWQAFTLAEPEIGQPKSNQQSAGLPLPKPGQMPPMPPMPPVEGGGLAAAAAGKPDPSMFDIPIQERMKMQQAAAAAQSAPGEAAPEGNRWDVPIQQRGMQPPPAPPVPGNPMAPAANAGGQFGAPPLPPPVPPVGAPPPAPGQAGGKNSIMDRLNKVLGDDLAAMAGGQPQQAGWGQSAPPVPETPAMPPVPPQFNAAPMAAPPPPMPAPQPVAAAAPSSGLLKVDDAAIDKVFAENLGVTEAARPVQAQAAPMAPPPVPPVAPQVPPAVPPAGAGGGPRISAVPPRGAAPAAEPAAAAAQAGGLFRNLDDRAMDQLFASNLGVQDQTAPVAAAPQYAAPTPPPMAPTPPPVAPTQSPAWNQAPAPQPQAPAPQPAAAGPRGLLSVDDDAMDRIFADLGVKDKPAPKINVREAVNQIRNLADVPNPPKVEGISRLSREESVSEPTPGKINAIGKFLLDQQDFAKIGRLTEQDLSDTKVRVLTHEASDEINRLLEHIANQPGVVGSVIVGHDGILIANSLPKEQDPETIGIFSLGIYINTTNTSKKMGHNHLHQLVCRTAIGYLVIADFGGGILVTVSNALETDKLIPLMRSITQLVAQS